MTSRTWIGGGLDLASTAKNWSPNGAPEPGDTLLMSSGIMNVVGYNLAGDTLTLTGTDTVNLLGASVTANVFPESPYVPDTDLTVAATFNLVDSTLWLTAEGEMFDEPATDGLSSTVVNLYGVDTFTLGPNNAVALTVNLAPDSVWKGSFNSGMSGPEWPFTSGIVDVNGAPGSTFYNDAASDVGGTVTIDAKVLGIGSFVSEGYFATLEFAKSVGAGQTVILGQSTPDGFSYASTLKLDDPTQFLGTVTMDTSDGTGGIAPGVIDLANLAKADSYTFKNDMLSIYGAGKVIDTLRLDNNTGLPLVVGKTGSTVVVGFYEATSIVLPMHT
jgi:hypothetical protein